MLRFTTRDLLWLMLVVALVICWYQDRERVRRTAHRDVQVELLKELVEKQDRQIREDWDKIDSLYAALEELRPGTYGVALPAGWRWKQTAAGRVMTREPVPANGLQDSVQFTDGVVVPCP